MPVVTLEPCQAGEGARGHVVGDEIGTCGPMATRPNGHMWPMRPEGVATLEGIGVSPNGLSTCVVMPSGGKDQHHYLCMGVGGGRSKVQYSQT